MIFPSWTCFDCLVCARLSEKLWPYRDEQNGVLASEELKSIVWERPHGVGKDLEGQIPGPSRKGGAQSRPPRGETSLETAEGGATLLRWSGIFKSHPSTDGLTPWSQEIVTHHLSPDNCQGYCLQYFVTLRIWRVWDCFEILQNFSCTRCHGALFYYL